MTPEQRTMALWGGGTALVLVVSLSVLVIRGATADRLHAQADALETRYQTLYHPQAPHAGVLAAEAEAELSKAKDLQSGQLDATEQVLVAQLGPGYRDTAVTQATHQVQFDHSSLITQAESAGVPLPKTLPLDKGLNGDAAVRAIELANLYLYRTVIDLCIQAKVTALKSVAMKPALQDPTGTYLLLSCTFEIDATYDSGQRLLEGLGRATTQGKGVGMSMLSIVQASDRLQNIKLTASLITPGHLAGPSLRASSGPNRAGGL